MLSIYHPIRKSIDSNIFLNLIRNAGGGGRPGGRPAFNWKEKKLLRLDMKNKLKEFKLRPFGDFSEDLEGLISEASGDKIIKIDRSKPFDDSTLNIEMSNSFNNKDKKTINISKLFGSNKPSGHLSKKSKSDHKYFSHSRIFGKPKDKKIVEL